MSLPQPPTHDALVAPCLLAVGGLDPGGGAGILADARAAKIAGAYACACVSLLTVQSTAGLVRATPIAGRELARSLREVLSQQAVDAIKVGALGSSDQVRVVAAALRKHRAVPVVVDTPRKPSRGGAALIDAKGWTSLVRDLMPLSTILTVNADEAGWMLNCRVRTLRDARAAALAIATMGTSVVVVKGGHLEGNATDIVAFGASSFELVAARAHTGPFHGTGCTFASLIAGRIAAKRTCVADLDGQLAAIRWAKKKMSALVQAPLNVGGPARVLG